MLAHSQAIITLDKHSHLKARHPQPFHIICIAPPILANFVSRGSEKTNWRLPEHPSYIPPLEAFTMHFIAQTNLRPTREIATIQGKTKAQFLRRNKMLYRTL